MNDGAWAIVASNAAAAHCDTFDGINFQLGKQLEGNNGTVGSYRLTCFNY